ncbi:MAG: hypothetical protein ACI86S_000532 [Paracoccaceae bacterium]|jgi:hypothetical protein
MGLIGRIFSAVFGDGRNMIVETAQVFRENAEAAGQRGAAVQQQAMQQFAAEFAQPRRGIFDRFVDALNRLPRPFLAFGTLGLFVTAMVNPIWFASRMQGIALVPEPLWWLMGAIVSFYFGARHQVHSQQFQRSIADTVSRAGEVTRNIRALDALAAGAQLAPADPVEARVDSNPALSDWQAGNDG